MAAPQKRGRAEEDHRYTEGDCLTYDPGNPGQAGPAPTSSSRAMQAAWASVPARADTPSPLEDSREDPGILGTCERTNIHPRGNPGMNIAEKGNMTPPGNQGVMPSAGGAGRLAWPETPKHTVQGM